MTHRVRVATEESGKEIIIIVYCLFEIMKRIAEYKRQRKSLGKNK
jgi:hypothetical protein